MSSRTPSIRRLPESLIRLIAAGEVVERPASVLKELVENSLDAGAARVTIDVWGAGQTRLRVSDDGEGMTPEDARLALERHATSKLKVFDDLHRLDTFGFRGEALPSIAAVSRLELSTRARGTREGLTLRLEGGVVKSEAPAGIPVGTTLDVQDLFFNTPARAKFLKRAGTERSHLLRTLQELAVAHPGVAFHLEMEGKPMLSLTAGDRRHRLNELWGSAAETLTAVDVEEGPCRIDGFTSTVEGHHATRSCQLLYVNHRPVLQKSLQHAVYEAYRGSLPVGRHPVFALFVEIDPAQVDVNVHPTKREVRFADERAVYDLLYRTVRKHLGGGSGSPPETLVPRWKAPRFVPQEAVSENLTLDIQTPSSFTLADAPTAAPVSTLAPVTTTRFLGQLQRVYLLFEDESGLLLLDQHAAAERVLYESLLAEAARGPVMRQRLLAPFVWDVTPDQVVVFQSILSDLDRLGFSLEPFGPRSFSLTELPAVVSELRDARRFLDELIGAFSEERPHAGADTAHRIAARAACRAAIMAGDPVTELEARTLFDHLLACEQPDTCPHGRPTRWRVSLDELHRRFRRPADA